MPKNVGSTRELDITPSQKEENVSEEVKSVARYAESMLQKRSVEFINGKRKIRLRDISVTYRKKLFLGAFLQARGNTTVACKAAGVGRRTAQLWMAEDVFFAEVVADIKETSIDFAEWQLFQNIEKGYEASIIFFLKTRARDRGYSEVLNVDHHQKGSIKDLSNDELDEKIRKLGGAVTAAGREEEETARE